MTKRFDPVLLLGAGLGLVASLFPLLLFKANRLVLGDFIGFPDLPVPHAYLMLLAFLALLASAFLPKFRLPIASSLVVISWLLLNWTISLTTRQLLADAPAIARVSFAPGFWLALFALYVACFALSQRWRWAFLLLPVAVLLGSWLGHYELLGPAVEFRSVASEFLPQTLRHLALSLVSLVLAALIGLPLGILAFRQRQFENIILGGAGLLQTLPSIALFGLLLPPLAYLGRSFQLSQVLIILAILILFIGLRWVSSLRFLGNLAVSGTLILALPLFGLWLVSLLSGESATLKSWLNLNSSLADIGLRGIGAAPVLIALTLYALLPIVVNTHLGLRNIPPGTLDAATGMGMNARQRFWRAEFPLALPFMMEGLRTALVLTFGITTVAALVGAGGLGFFILRGVENAAPDLVLLGALPIVLLALVLDSFMRGLSWLLTPKGLRS